MPSRACVFLCLGVFSVYSHAFSASSWDVCGVGAWLRSYGGTELEEVVGKDLFA